MRVFLDANILFSAVKSDGAVRQFLGWLRAQNHTLVADGYVICEARRNVEAKFAASAVNFERCIAGVETTAKTAPPLAPDLCPKLPEKDRPVLASAILLRCDVLLTGDKAHFGPLYGETVSGVTIHSPASLAQLLLAR